MATERKPVQRRIKPRQEVAAPSQIVDRTRNMGEIDTGPAERSSRIAESLVRFSQAAGSVVDREVQRKIELDKVTQRQRFFEGQDPTADATRPGRRAYDILTARDKATEIQNKVYRQLASDPGMSDEAFEEMTRKEYNQLYNQYESDPLTTKALTSVLADSQQTLVSARSQLRAEHQQREAIGAYTASVQDSLEGSTPAQLRESLQKGALNREASALYLTPEQRDAALVQQARNTAAAGDGRLLKAMEGIDRFKSNEGVLAARDAYNSAKATQASVAIGSRTADIDGAWVSGGATWGETEQALNQINRDYPGTITAAYTRGLKARGLKAAEDRRKATDALDKYTQGFFTNTPLAMRQDVTPKQSRDAAKAYEERLAVQTSQLIESNTLESPDAQAWAVGQKLAFTESQGVVMPGLKDSLAYMGTVSPDVVDRNPEALDSMVGTLRGIRGADRSTLEMYASGKNLEVLSVYKQLAPARGDRDAWRIAWESVHDPVDRTPEESKQIRTELSRGVDEAFDAGAIDRIFRDWSNPDEAMKRDLRTQMNSLAETYMRNGGTVESAISDAADTLANGVTGLNNGSYVRANKRNLAAAANVSPEATPFLWERYFEENKAALREVSLDDELEYGDVRVHVSPTNGTWWLTDANSVEYLTDPQPLSNMQRYAVDAEELLKRHQLSAEGYERESDTRLEGLDPSTYERMRQENR